VAPDAQVWRVLASAVQSVARCDELAEACYERIEDARFGEPDRSREPLHQVSITGQFCTWAEVWLRREPNYPW